jgi:hypothetical protein
VGIFEQGHQKGNRQGHQQGPQEWYELGHELWRELREKFTKTRYTQALEAEVARLRAENRAMLNSILGIAGVPPIPAQESEVAAVREATGAGTVPEGAQPPRRAVAGSSPRSTGGQVPTPLRRRSWHQINRMLEFQSAHQEHSAPTDGSQEKSKT